LSKIIKFIELTSAISMIEQGSKWHFACAWGSVLKKLIAQFSSFQVPPR
jgi:hypothetical protein